MSTETALYARVSTTDQNLARQQEHAWDYAVDQLGVAPADIAVYEDKAPAGIPFATTIKRSSSVSKPALSSA